MSHPGQQSASSAPVNGHTAPHELFALSDEQILDIEPESVILSEAKNLSSAPRTTQAEHASASAEFASQLANHTSPSVRDESPRAEERGEDTGGERDAAQPHGTQARVPVLPAEPPPWLADMMADPQAGGEARDLWDGVQHARQQAADSAAYRAAFASPEDARALKELYPGGVAEARSTAQRARVLDEIDRAYFGAASGSPEQASATRAQLAAAMLREDPAAFREMVFAGLRALEQAGQHAPAPHSGDPSLGARYIVPAQGPGTAHAASPLMNGIEGGSGVGAQNPAQRLDGSFAAHQEPAHAAAHRENSSPQAGDARSAPLAHANTPSSDAHLAAYAAFEKAANADLERSVGGAIDRALEQALPNAARMGAPWQAGAQSAAPLRETLSGAIRQNIEKALQGDRQLGEQVAQVLSSRRLDAGTRAQVVRLIAERAQQLVPGAAKRVINEWTQTTLAAHRSRAQRRDEAGSSREAAGTSRGKQAQAGVAGQNETNGSGSRGSEREISRSAQNDNASGDARQGSSSRSDDARRAENALDPRRGAAAASRSRRVDYRRFSDEQILDM